jgi:hypothetical protein
MKKTLHPLPADTRPDSQADYAHQFLISLLTDDTLQDAAVVAFEFTPYVQSKLEEEFFTGSIPRALLDATDWQIHAETSHGWEISLINQEVMHILAGLDGVRGPAPLPLAGQTVDLDPRFDLEWLADLPHITALLVPHSMDDLGFLSHVALLEELILDDISCVTDFSPISQLTQLKKLQLGNGDDYDPPIGGHTLELLRKQVPRLSELELTLW